MVPADQPRVNLEGLKRSEVTAEPRDGVTHDGVGLVLTGDAKNARAREPMDATQVGECEKSAVVDVKVEVQVIRPHA
jgi:hypothetical protein